MPAYGWKIYVFEFSDKCAYVGLTTQLDIRKRQHFCGGPVARQFQKCSEYGLKILDIAFSSDEASKLEKSWYEIYRKLGWTMLNEASCGALGGKSQFTDDEIVESALKFKLLIDWRTKCRKQYVAAARRGRKFFDFCTSHLIRRKRDQFSEQTILESARKYRSRLEWRISDPVIWLQARRRGRDFYEKCVEFMPRNCARAKGFIPGTTGFRLVTK
jgi:predicted GIY-YIG superfamily endonuclease